MCIENILKKTEKILKTLKNLRKCKWFKKKHLKKSKDFKIF